METETTRTKRHPFAAIHRRVSGHIDSVGGNPEQAAASRVRKAIWAGRIALTALAITGAAAVVHRFQDGGVREVVRGTKSDLASVANGTKNAEAQNMSSPEKTIITSTATTLGESATAAGVRVIHCDGTYKAITVHSIANTPQNEIIHLNPGISAAQALEIYNSPVFNGMNSGGFDANQLHAGSRFNVPTNC